MMFVPFEEEDITDAIESVETKSINVLDNQTQVFYNLNGQKLEGKPNKSGIYILNGKKIAVK